FSSRRRHTRFSRDWSSDVCSSDLCATNERHSCCTNNSGFNAQARSRALSISLDRSLIKITAYHSSLTTISLAFFSCSMQIRLHRSEERRVGKEWSSRSERQDQENS